MFELRTTGDFFKTFHFSLKLSQFLSRHQNGFWSDDIFLVFYKTIFFYNLIIHSHISSPESQCILKRFENYLLKMDQKSTIE